MDTPKLCNRTRRELDALTDTEMLNRALAVEKSEDELGKLLDEARRRTAAAIEAVKADKYDPFEGL